MLGVIFFMIKICKNCKNKIKTKNYTFDLKIPFYFGVYKDKSMKLNIPKTISIKIIECDNCGLIYQELSSKIKLLLKKLYLGNFSNISTNMQSSNMGKERFNVPLSESRENSCLNK